MWYNFAAYLICFFDISNYPVSDTGIYSLLLSRVLYVSPMCSLKLDLRIDHVIGGLSQNLVGMRFGKVRLRVQKFCFFALVAFLSWDLLSYTIGVVDLAR
jgi:hypothetical protein